MNVLLNLDGSRNRENRPYIDKEEQSNNLPIYDPHRAPRFGLYDGVQPPCGNYADNMRNHIQRHNLKPSAVVDRAGRGFIRKYA